MQPTPRLTLLTATKAPNDNQSINQFAYVQLSLPQPSNPFLRLTCLLLGFVTQEEMPRGAFFVTSGSEILCQVRRKFSLLAPFNANGRIK